MSDRGLVTREIASRAPGVTVVREVWDLTVPGCPMANVRLSSFGIDKRETLVERIYQVSTEDVIARPQPDTPG